MPLPGRLTLQLQAAFTKRERKAAIKSTNQAGLFALRWIPSYARTQPPPARWRGAIRHIHQSLSGADTVALLLHTLRDIPIKQPDSSDQSNQRGTKRENQNTPASDLFGQTGICKTRRLQLIRQISAGHAFLHTN